VLAPDSIPVFDVERGGDVTWHGPGQLVAYPIVRLTGKRQDLRLHLRSLEEAVIGLLGDWGLAGQRDDRNTGVWLPVDQGTPLKVCSIGIACRRWVTWHGLALNVTTDLTRFATIRPCGFDAGIMTRLADWLDPCPAHALLQDQLVPWLGKTLALQTPWRHVRSSSTDPKEVLQCIAQDDAHD